MAGELVDRLGRNLRGGAPTPSTEPDAAADAATLLAALLARLGGQVEITPEEWARASVDAPFVRLVGDTKPGGFRAVRVFIGKAGRVRR